MNPIPRNIYDPSVDQGIDCSVEPSLTKQSSKAECDINNIMKKALKTGLIDHVAAGQPMFGDFSIITDYQEALNKVREADESFMELDADIRKRFLNDPQVLMDFLADKNNLEEARELGLVLPAPPVPSTGVPQVIKVDQPPKS